MALHGLALKKTRDSMIKECYAVQVDNVVTFFDTKKGKDDKRVPSVSTRTFGRIDWVSRPDWASSSEAMEFGHAYLDDKLRPETTVTPVATTTIPQTDSVGNSTPPPPAAAASMVQEIATRTTPEPVPEPVRPVDLPQNAEWDTVGGFWSWNADDVIRWAYLNEKHRLVHGTTVDVKLLRGAVSARKNAITGGIVGVGSTGLLGDLRIESIGPSLTVNQGGINQRVAADHLRRAQADG